MPINHVPNGFEKRHIFFDESADPIIRESLAYLIPLPEHGLGIIYYTFVHALGKDGQARAGAMMIVFGPSVEKPIFEVCDNIFVPDSLAFDNWEVGPAHMTLSDDMMSGHLRFEVKDLSLDVDWRGQNPSFAFLSNRNGCPSWLAKDRTEQGVIYKGRVTVNGKKIAIDNYGHRDHSWGHRDWGGPTHWKWWNIVGPNQTAVHAMELQAFGTTTLHGYVHKDGVIGTILSMDPKIEFDDRFMHTRIQATIVDDEGRTTKIETTYGADLIWPVSAYLTLHEAAMFATIDGVPGAAYMEMAWPPAYAEHHRRVDAGGTRGADGLMIDGAKT